jgi:hypothetical protein
MTVRIRQPRVCCPGYYENRSLPLLLQFAPVSLGQALTVSPSFWHGKPDVYVVSLLSCPYFTLHPEQIRTIHNALLGGGRFYGVLFTTIFHATEKLRTHFALLTTPGNQRTALS